MIKIRKRKNPYETSNLVENILLDIDYGELSDEGQYAQTYKFKLIRKTFIYNQYLPAGIYVLKILRKITYNSDMIDYLLKMSDLELIPEIFIITKNFTIMKFQKGLLFYEYIRKITRKQFEILLQNLQKILEDWQKLGFEHGDLSSRNIIIDKDEIYLIDPSFHTLSYRNFIGEKIYDRYKMGTNDRKSVQYLAENEKWTTDW